MDAPLSLFQRCKSAAFNPFSGECRLSHFDEKDARSLYHPQFNYYKIIRNDDINNIAASEKGRFYYQNYEGPSPQRKFNFPLVPDLQNPAVTQSYPQETEEVTHRDHRRSSIRCGNNSGIKQGGVHLHDMNGKGCIWSLNKPTSLHRFKFIHGYFQ